MKLFSYFRVEIRRLLRSAATQMAFAAAAVSPLLGFYFYQPAGTGTTAAKVIANPSLAGALGGAAIFAALALYELNRVKKYQMETLTDSIVSPVTMAVVRLWALLSSAFIAFFIIYLLYLPLSRMLLGEAFKLAEYTKAYLIFLLPSLLLGTILASAFYQIFYRVDLSFVLFSVTVLASLGSWNAGSYLPSWLIPATAGFSGDLGNTSLYRLGTYNRLVWFCLFGGFWLLSLLCVRSHGKKLPGSFLLNMKKRYLPVFSLVLFYCGGSLYVCQPYMDHEPPRTLDADQVTGGNISYQISEEEDTNENLSIQQVSLELRPDVGKGIAYGKASYQMINTSGKAQHCLMDLNPGYTIEHITVNGEEIPFTDLENDHYLTEKNVSLTLPSDRGLQVEVTYRGRVQIPDHSSSIFLYHEITPEYISLGGNNLIPGMHALTGQGCTFYSEVTLPSHMELVAKGKNPEVSQTDEHGNRTWILQGEGCRPSFFAGNYVRLKIENQAFPVYFCYSKTHQEEFEKIDIEKILTNTIAYCTNLYGPLPYTEEYPLNIVMTNAHMMGGGASANLSYMGESFFTAESLSNPDKGASSAEIIAHEIVHQWWGTECFVMDPENMEWSSEALTCYTTYRMAKEQYGGAYAKKYYADVWQDKLDDLNHNFYLRNPQYLAMLPEQFQDNLHSLILDAGVYAKAPLQVLKAETLVGGEKEMDQVLSRLFNNGGTEMPPFVTWQDFLDACGLIEDQLDLEGGKNIG